MNYRFPIFIQAGIGQSAESSAELVKRWDSYGNRVKIATGGQQSRIVVFLPNSMVKSLLLTPKHLELISFSDTIIGRVKLVFTLRDFLKEDASDFATFVAGDLFISPLIAVFAKCLSGAHVRIQIQFHGAAYHEKIRSFRSLMRVTLMRLALRKADSIRVVSNFQISEIKRMVKLDSKEFVLAPIPVNQKKISKVRVEHIGLALLIMGRLHKERGIHEFKDFLTLLNNTNLSCLINVVGEGPHFEELTSYSKILNKDIKIKFHGRLDENAVRNQLSINDVLLSFAPQEGYGLAIREAILSGLVVIAKRNPGTNELLNSHPQAVRLFNSAREAVSLVENFVPVEAAKESLSKLRKAQEDSDSRYLDELIMSWVKL